MKSRVVFGLLAVMAVLAFASSSFAQVTITAFNPASASEISTNRSAETSDPLSAQSGIQILGSVGVKVPLATTNLIVTFPGPVSSGISNSNDTRPSGDLIRIVGASGVFTNATILTRSGSTITIALIGCANYVRNTDGPVFAACAAGGDMTTGDTNNVSGQFKIVSSRIDATSLSGSGPFNASLSLNNTSNGFLLGTTSFPVINTLGEGVTIAQNVITGTNPGPLGLFTNKTPVNLTSSLLLTEPFAFAWRTESDNERNSGSAAGVGADFIRLTFAGIPATASITLGTPTFSTGASATIINASIPTSSGGLQAFVRIDGARNDTIDQIQIPITLVAPTSNPSIGTITVTASMFPTTSSSGYVSSVTDTSGDTTSRVVPRFNAKEVGGPLTIGNIVAASTTLLLPLADKLGVFDTGISVANTTADPFGTNGGATPTAGKLTLDFFPRNAANNGAGTPFNLTTSATVKPGAGLSADGTLAAGGTWTVLLSELLAAAGQTADFTGYIFIRTDFLNAHGMATITDFKGFSLASQVLVLSPPTVTGRSSTAVESLNQ